MSSELRRKNVNEVAVTQYDISVIPNDFNITLRFRLTTHLKRFLPSTKRHAILLT